MTIATPRTKGPALNALRAFEAAARQGSFSAAAEELSVTPGAVAQHVKAVEAWAGGALFLRHPQGVALTGLGESLLPAFTEAFDRLGEAVHLLRTRATPNQLRIAALPSIALLWLSPRLPALRSTAKEATISITAMDQRPNYKREHFDLGIFFEEPPLAAGAQEICRDVVFPVCRADIAAQLGDPSDLAGVTCLHDAMWQDDWPLWLARACPERHIDIRGPVFSLYSLALEEAKNGAGVVMGHAPLIQAELRSGQLVAPFATTVESGRFLTATRVRAPGENLLIDNLIDRLTTVAGVGR